MDHNVTLKLDLSQKSTVYSEFQSSKDSAHSFIALFEVSGTNSRTLDGRLNGRGSCARRTIRCFLTTPFEQFSTVF